MVALFFDIHTSMHQIYHLIIISVVIYLKNFNYYFVENLM